MGSAEAIQVGGGVTKTPGQAAANEDLLIAAAVQPEDRRMDAKLDRLPVQLDVAIPLREFRVRDLLALEPGRVVETEWVNGDDLPLFAGSVQLAWSEFEVVDVRLGVRVTRLA